MSWQKCEWVRESPFFVLGDDAKKKGEKRVAQTLTVEQAPSKPSIRRASLHVYRSPTAAKKAWKSRGASVCARANDRFESGKKKTE